MQNIQIVGGNTFAHWRGYYFDGMLLNILDSLYPTAYSELQDEEKNSIKLSNPNLQVKGVVSGYVQGQPDLTNCGVYAAAFAMALIIGRNPSEKK